MGKDEIKFDSITTADELSEYLVKEYHHTSYNHYTKLDIIDNILKGKTFWVSDVNGFNDKIDKDQFDNSLCFSLCFSTGVNENLTLWYLYSGVEGKGGHISFTKAMIKKLIKDGKYELWEFVDNAKKEKICDLLDGDNCTIQFKDILYYGEKRGVKNVSLKYNTKTNYKLKQEEFDKYRSKAKGFLKTLIWYAEKETRLLIKLDEGLKKKLDDKKKYKVLLKFGHIKRMNFKIKLAPENVDYSEISKHKFIDEF